MKKHSLKLFFIFILISQVLSTNPSISLEKKASPILLLEGFTNSRMQASEHSAGIIESRENLLSWCKQNLWGGENVANEILNTNDVDFSKQVIIWIVGKSSTNYYSLTISKVDFKGGVLRIDINDPAEARAGQQRLTVVSNPAVLYVTDRNRLKLRDGQGGDILRKVEFYRAGQTHPFISWTNSRVKSQDTAYSASQARSVGHSDNVALLESRFVFNRKNARSEAGVVTNPQQFIELWNDFIWRDETHALDLLDSIDFDNQIVFWVLGNESNECYGLDLAEFKFGGGFLKAVFSIGKYEPASYQSFFANYLGASPLKIYVADEEHIPGQRTITDSRIKTAEFFMMGSRDAFFRWAGN